MDISDRVLSLVLRPGTQRRKGSALLCALGGLFYLVFNSATFLHSITVQQQHQQPPLPAILPQAQAQDDLYAPSKYVLRGEPALLFSTNLKPELKYITGWINAGWTNDVMTYTNLLYLALLTGRIPILGPFVPSHLSTDAGYLPFGEVFDVPALARALHAPVLQWSDVKRLDSARYETMGCWSTWMAFEPASRGRGGWVPDIIDVDVSYTPVPPSTREHEDPTDPHLTFGALLPLAFPAGRALALSAPASTPRPSDLFNDTLPPGDHLLCFDFLYYLKLGAKSGEWDEDYAPAWRAVGVHMRWEPRLVGKAEAYLRRHFAVAEGEPIPPYISVHMRRADFAEHCGGASLSCMPSLRQLRRRVREVQAALLARKGQSTDRVLVTSDELDPAWWAEVTAEGWGRVDHEALGTIADHGDWYPSLLDSVFLSMGAGFIGTEGSTMSLVALRRVQDWNGGPGVWLRWRGVPEGEL